MPVDVKVTTPDGKKVGEWRTMEDGTHVRIPQENKMPEESMLQFFKYEHLPTRLQEVSKPFHALAHHIVETIRRNPERTVALRKLLEAKDCAVRAELYISEG